MASDNVLNLVNKVLRITGDLDPINTVMLSPANIAERIIDYFNLVLTDVTRKIEFPELQYVFSGVADGLNPVFMSAIQFSKISSGVSCTVSGVGNLEEVSPARFLELKSMPQGQSIAGRPIYFMRTSGTLTSLAVEVFPVPSAGMTVTVLTYTKPLAFVLADTSATEVNIDDILVYGAVAHLDAYDGIDRGYMNLYARAKTELWQHTYQGEQYRTQCESYL